MPILTLSFPSRSFVESKSCRYSATWATNQMNSGNLARLGISILKIRLATKNNATKACKKRRSHRSTSAASKGRRLLVYWRKICWRLAWRAPNLAGGNHMSAHMKVISHIWYDLLFMRYIYYILYINDIYVFLHILILCVILRLRRIESNARTASHPESIHKVTRISDLCWCDFKWLRKPCSTRQII